MDGDFSHDPEDIPRFLETAEDADLVLGTRYQGGIRVINWPLTASSSVLARPSGAMDHRHALQRSYRWLQVLSARGAGGHRSRAGSVQRLQFSNQLTHKIWRQGLRISEVPIVFTERMEGQSKMSGNIVWEAIWMVWQLLFQNGLRRWPENHHEQHSGRIVGTGHGRGASARVRGGGRH